MKYLFLNHCIYAVFKYSYLKKYNHKYSKIPLIHNHVTGQMLEYQTVLTLTSDFMGNFCYCPQRKCTASYFCFIIKRLCLLIIISTVCPTHNYLRTMYFWVITQQVMVISYGHFGTTFQSQFQGSSTTICCIKIHQNTVLIYFTPKA